MADSSSTSSNLSLTVAHTISFLTRPLIASHSATVIIKLQLALEANLTALYAPSWVVDEPLRGSGRRCLTLSPDCLPPRPIYAACVSTSIQWYEWIAALGNQSFDLFVDPGCVSVRYGQRDTPNGKFITIWVDEIASPTPRRPVFDIVAPTSQTKTFAQRLLENDYEDDDQLFSLIADEIRAPTWTTPVEARFPLARPTSSLSSISIHSRSSSRSSNSSSTFSSCTASSATSLSGVSIITEPDLKPKHRRAARPRQGRIFVDKNKTEVTPYDGGKTTVLTGGVMLGAYVNATKPTKMDKIASWRSL